MIDDADGFDHYGTSASFMKDGAWAEAFSAAPSTDFARTGTYSLELGASVSAIARKVFHQGAQSVAGVALALYTLDLPNANLSMVPISFRDTGNDDQLSIVIQSTGQIAAVRGSKLAPTVLGTSDSAGLKVTANAWNHIEAWVGIGDGTAGWVEVRLNGVTVLNLTDVDTQATSNAETSQFAILNWTTRAGQFSWYVDDVIILNDQGGVNDTFIGDKKVFTDFPDADTADVDWTPSAGSDLFAMIDEAVPDQDATYDESDTAGQAMGVTFPNVDPSIIGIAGIVLLHKSKKTDAGLCTVQATCQSGGSEQAGTDRPMTTAYTLYADVFEVDPDTSAPWTTAAANAMALKLDRTA